MKHHVHKKRSVRAGSHHGGLEVQISSGSVLGTSVQHHSRPDLGTTRVSQYDLPDLRCDLYPVYPIPLGSGSCETSLGQDRKHDTKCVTNGIERPARQNHLTQNVLSPIAITVRDQTIKAVRAADIESVRVVVGEVLDVNTAGIPLDSPEMKLVVASVVEGVHAALAGSRAEVLQMTLHAVARFASSRGSTDPTVVAAVICDAANVIEVANDDRQVRLDATIDSVLTACDHLLGPNRDALATFLRNALPMFFERRHAETFDEPGANEPGSS